MSNSYRFLDRQFVIEICQSVLASIDKKTDILWKQAEIDIRNEVRATRLKKSKFSWNNLLPTKYVEPSDEEIQYIMNHSSIDFWEWRRSSCPAVWITGSRAPYRHVQMTASNVLRLAEFEPGARDIAITTEDWRLIQIGVDLHESLRQS